MIIRFPASPPLIECPAPSGRDMASDAKRPKDLYQAYQILSVLQENRPFDIQPAWEDLIDRGPKWKKYAEAGLSAMEKQYGKLTVNLMEG